MGTRRLVEVEDELWGRVRVRAVEEGRTVVEVVGNALRLYVTGGVTTRTEEDPVREKGDGHGDRGFVADGVRDSVADGGAEGAERKARLVKALAGAVVTGRELVQGKTSAPDPLHGIPAVIGTCEEFPLTSRPGEYLGQSREGWSEERIQAIRRDRLRTHQEDENQARDEE